MEPGIELIADNKFVRVGDKSAGGALLPASQYTKEEVRKLIDLLQAAYAQMIDI